MNPKSTQKEIRVCIDVGFHKHYVAIGYNTGESITGFHLAHTHEEIAAFFRRLQILEEEHQLPISIAMEGYNGYVRPIDTWALAKGYRVLSVNNLKLNRFKEIFPGAAKSDPIDARKMLEMWAMHDVLPVAPNILQEVEAVPEVNAQLKWFTRRRRDLLKEKTRLSNRLGTAIQAVSPGLLEISGEIDNLWFLRFLVSRDNLEQLTRMQRKSLLKIKGVGEHYAKQIQQWQAAAFFGPELKWIGHSVVRDARKLLELREDIATLDAQLEGLVAESEIGSRLLTIDGCGLISAAELAGEIGTLSRFSSERGLALYVGVAPLTYSSGKMEGAKTARQVNKRAKSAMHTISWHHIRLNPRSRVYYDKKIAEGKYHNVAVRAHARHLVRVIWAMLKKKEDFASAPMPSQRKCA